MSPNQKLPAASPFLDKLGATPPDAREDQKTATGTEPVSGFHRGDQVASLGANASVFQPSPVRNLPDMVSDYEASEPMIHGAEDTFQASLGGRSILVAGADNAVATPDAQPTVKGL